HPATPAADPGDLTGPVERPQVFWIEPPPVIEREIPVAVRPLGARRPGSAKSDGRHCRQPAQPLRDVHRELRAVHHVGGLTAVPRAAARTRFTRRTPPSPRKESVISKTRETATPKITKR